VLEQGVLTLHAGSPDSNAAVLNAPSHVYDLVGTRSRVGSMSDELGALCKWPSSASSESCFVIKVPLQKALYLQLLGHPQPERWREVLEACARAHLPSHKSNNAPPGDAVPRQGFSGRVASGRTIGNDTLYKCYALYWDGEHYERVTSIATLQDLRSMQEELALDPMVTVQLPSFPQAHVPPCPECHSPRACRRAHGSVFGAGWPIWCFRRRC
jgi:hypothetical protein